MEIKGGKTLRGFRRYWFTDSNGRLCDLQDSSNADGHCIWFGVDGAFVASVILTFCLLALLGFLVL